MCLRTPPTWQASAATWLRIGATCCDLLWCRLQTAGGDLLPAKFLFAACMPPRPAQLICCAGGQCPERPLPGELCRALGLGGHAQLVRFIVMCHRRGTSWACSRFTPAACLSPCPCQSYVAGLAGLAGPLHGLANQETLRWVHGVQQEVRLLSLTNTLLYPVDRTSRRAAEGQQHWSAMQDLPALSPCHAVAGVPLPN